MEQLKELQQINPWIIIGALITILLFWSFIQELLEKTFGKLIRKFGIKFETQGMRQRREDHELLIKVSENLVKLQERHTKDEEEFRKNLNDYMAESRKDRKALHDEMKQYATNRINDRQQSLEIQRELKGSQNEITDKVDNISKKLNEMEKKENKRVQSEIKERIAQSYREYKKTKKITSEELEALEDLIETYETHGGENSFVHSLVQKEMYTWEVE
jgi:hypothetical protein